MSWHCSQALVAEFSAVICSDGDVSAPSSTTPTPEAYYWPDKTTEHSRLSRFGMTSEPLTESRGEELLMSYQAGFRARTSALPEKAQGLKASEADYGPRWHGSFAKYDRDSSLWKTAQCSLVEDLERFLGTWPKWGSMRNGDAYLRQTPEHLTCENEYGLWQTPVADDAVERAAGKWNSRGEPKLSAQVKLWPTPTAITNSGGAALCKWGGSGSREKLRQMVTPEELNGQLNPTWVEWLMGWIIGWTDLKPLETAKFREWQQQHSLSLPADSTDKQAA